jgi:hypothetical protein
MYSTMRGQLNLVYSPPKNFEAKRVDSLNICQRLSTCFCSFFDLRCFKTHEISRKSPIINPLLPFPVDVKKAVEQPRIKTPY